MTTKTTTALTSKITQPRKVVDTVLAAVAKYESEKRWGKIVLTFQDGKPVMMEETTTSKLQG